MADSKGEKKNNDIPKDDNKNNNFDDFSQFAFQPKV